MLKQTLIKEAIGKTIDRVFSDYSIVVIVYTDQTFSAIVALHGNGLDKDIEDYIVTLEPDQYGNWHGSWSWEFVKAGIYTEEEKLEAMAKARTRKQEWEQTNKRRQLEQLKKELGES